MKNNRDIDNIKTDRSGRSPSAFNVQESFPIRLNNNNVRRRDMVIVASSHETSFSPKNIADVPHAPGVYHLINNLRVVIYIGKGANLHSRLYQHYNGRAYNAYYFRWYQTRTRSEADHLETIHINKYDPVQNINKTSYGKRG